MLKSLATDSIEKATGSRYPFERPRIKLLTYYIIVNLPSSLSCLLLMLMMMLMHFFDDSMTELNLF